jgi:flavin reductase
MSSITTHAGSTFLEAMREAVTGVTVVTTDGAHGRWGQTVSAMCSVSADPPLLLACVNRRSPLAVAIEANGVFCVNVLTAAQAAVADTFAGRPAAGTPFDFGCAAWERAQTGAPLLAGALVRFDCELSSCVDAGTHTIFIGSVVAADTSPGAPLIYTRRAYARPERLERNWEHA